jgi:ubiquinone/menaquinone biosynthesis C-methylase UbiE
MQTKDIQGKLWSTAPSDWATFLEPTFIPLYQEVLKHIDLDEEKMILDAGCGSGLFLTMASSTGARVVGIDAAPGLLEITKQRLPGVSLLIEDLEALPFIDGTFDVVTGFNSFHYAGSFQNALAEARRVVKRHGTVVIGIWGKEENCEATAVHKAVGSLLPPPIPGMPGPFTLSEEGKVEELCASVGLKVMRRISVLCPWKFNNNEELLKGFLSTAPCVKAVEQVGEEKVKETILNSSQPFNIADDVYFMRNSFTFFITEKK